jgi:hypothetical protein
MVQIPALLSAALISSVAARAFPQVANEGGPIVSPYQKDDSGGSGPYKAAYQADPSLSQHTIYAPKEPPQNISLPIVVWGEGEQSIFFQSYLELISRDIGACANQGTAFVNLLTEIASHGYVVLANGPPGTPGSPFGFGSTSPAMLTESMDWVDAGKDAGKYGKLDKTKIAAAGQSCGGMQAMAVSSDPRVKLVGLFNSGLFGSTAETPMIKNLKVPAFYLLGGTGDIAYANVSNRGNARLRCILIVFRE